MNTVNKKIAAWALLGLGIASLAACGNKPAEPSSSASVVSSTSSQAPSSSTSVSHSPSDIYIEASIKNATLRSGANFFDAACPSVIFHDGKGTEKDVYNYTFKTTYSIVDKNDENKTYGAGDPLPAGEYVCNIKYQNGKNYRDSVNFSVAGTTPEAASEGHGYRTYTTDDIADYKYMNYTDIDTLGGHGMPSVGNVNILVIPVQFNNIKFDNPETVHDILDEAFNADSDHTPWESLSSYYKKASFGKLNIKADVTPIYTYNADDTTVSKSGLASTICSSAVKWLKENHGYKMADYDSDKDGYIDGIEIVYITTNPTPSSSGEESSDSTWWNYTTNVSGSRNVNDPGARRMFWSRWDYLTNAYYADSPKGILLNGKKVDPHTIIHETGHMMGAPDYYSYDHDEGVAGCVDMMDMNVGDHNAYTKMQYGWVAPKVIDGSSNDFTITLSSYSETGEFLLVRNTVEENGRLWNGTPFDEFLILEYYTPTNLNEMDSTGYAEWQQTSSSGSSAYGHGGTYGHPGLQVFHADGRVIAESGAMVDGKKDTSNVTHIYSENPKPSAWNDDTHWESAASRIHSNTSNASGHASSSLDKDGYTVSPTKVRELTAILPSGVNSFSSSSYYNGFGNMANLFGLNGVDIGGWTGDAEAQSADSKYGGSSYNNYSMRDFYINTYTWNDNSKLNWSFQITAQTADSITLHFLNNAAK